ncbi:MAG TPA: molybdenum ABC transporter ATP-binding protein [Brevundimonas sp.]|uniref:molybdenum ABC transporter ATP-binding protein n=1 Tax=Brevundimonas sp. TaxID=1871086 RepID=UPI002C8A69A0|nr:molybdenum ABC transporter ATP-binding protein [Brevundimonas sp.]HRH20091.1 molybdenum ABC transporter ATP-binding protein [Brevundimonas sp.]
MIEAQATIRRGTQDFAIDISVAQGVAVLFGRSGSGKTSVADLIAGLVKPRAGRVLLNGHPVSDAATRTHIPAWRRRIGYVFQDARLFPHLSVTDNLLYGARRRRLAGDNLDSVVALLGLEDHLTKRPGVLSGGEARRVAIGRALLSGPELLILDEPLSGLDGARKAEVLPFLDRLARSGPPILYITHSVEETARLADEVLLAADGRVFNAGPPSEAFARPEAADAAGLGAPISVLEGRAAGADSGPAQVVDLGGTTFHTPPLRVAPGERVRIVVDARDVALALTAPSGVSFQNQLAARIEALVPGTGGWLVHLSGPGFRLASLVTAEAAQTLGLAPGREVVALVKATAAARYA